MAAKMKKTDIPKKPDTLQAKVPSHISMSEPERFEKVRQVFARRGLPNLSLSAILRIVLDEFTKAGK
jgi:hypothetical protein